MTQALKQAKHAVAHFSIGFTVSYSLYPHLGISTAVGAAEMVGASLGRGHSLPQRSGGLVDA